MNLNDLKPSPQLAENLKLQRQFDHLNQILNAIRPKEIPSTVGEVINTEIDAINNFSGGPKALKKQLRKAKSKILILLEKEVKLVPKNYYRNKWTALGITAFGIPIGLVFGTTMNMAFLGLGIPIGLAIGIAIGTDLDRKAKEQGNQLDLEMEF